MTAERLSEAGQCGSKKSILRERKQATLRQLKSRK